VLWCIDEQLVIAAEVALLRVVGHLAILILYLHLLLILFKGDFYCAPLRSLDQQENVILRFFCLLLTLARTLFLFVDIDEVLLNDVSKLMIRLIIFQLITEVFYLGQTHI
jgi:hypothetical protein